MDKSEMKSSHKNGSAAASDLAAEAQEQLEELRTRAREVGDKVVGFIKERPVTALLVAVGAGYLVGRILRS